MSRTFLAITVLLLEEGVGGRVNLASDVGIKTALCKFELFVSLIMDSGHTPSFFVSKSKFHC